MHTNELITFCYKPLKNNHKNDATNKYDSGITYQNLLVCLYSFLSNQVKETYSVSDMTITA